MDTAPVYTCRVLSESVREFTAGSVKEMVVRSSQNDYLTFYYL